MNSFYIIQSVKQKPANTILHTETNNLKNIDTTDEITMGIVSSLHLNYYGTRKLHKIFLYELAKLD